MVEIILDLKSYAAFTDYIKGLSPSTLDMEPRIILQIINDNDQQEDEKRPELEWIDQLLDYFIYELSCINNFEFLQAVIGLILKIHCQTIRQHSHLQEKARKLLDIQCMVWQRVDKLFQSVRGASVHGLVGFLSNSQIHV